MREFLFGKNLAKEVILSNSSINLVYVTNSNQDIIKLARSKKIPIKIVDHNYLSNLVKGTHQGVVLEVENYRYYSLEDILLSSRKEYPVLVILDGLEDPHNLGAVLRTCDASGVDGVIIPKHHSVGLNATVAKVSTGAIEYVKVCEVTNLTTTIKYLKSQGYWIVGAEAKEGSVDFRSIKYDMPVALIIGSEGKGISRLVLEQCDYVVKIPMYGKINSLNASVSCAILVYEIIKYRKE